MSCLEFYSLFSSFCEKIDIAQREIYIICIPLYLQVKITHRFVLRYSIFQQLISRPVQKNQISTYRYPSNLCFQQVCGSRFSEHFLVLLGKIEARVYWHWLHSLMMNILQISQLLTVQSTTSAFFCNVAGIIWTWLVLCFILLWFQFMFLLFLHDYIIRFMWDLISI